MKRLVKSFKYLLVALICAAQAIFESPINRLSDLPRRVRRAYYAGQLRARGYAPIAGGAAGNITGNLQTSMAGAITGGSADVFVPELWASETLDAAEFGQVIQKRVDRHYEEKLTVGDTVNVGRISNMTASDKAKDTDFAFEVITETKQQVTAALHKYAAFLVEDIVKVQSAVDLRAKYTKKVAYALNRSIETNLAGMFSGLSANTAIGTLGVELTSDDYLSAWTYMAQAGLLEDNPDPSEDFSVIYTPAAHAAAMKIDVFANRFYNPTADTVQRMKFGDVYGFPVFISNLLTASGAGHQCVAMHRSQFALLIQRQPKVESDHLIWKGGDAVVGTCIFGGAEINFPPETAGGGSAVDNRGVLLNTL